MSQPPPNARPLARLSPRQWGRLIPALLVLVVSTGIALQMDPWPDAEGQPSWLRAWFLSGEENAWLRLAHPGMQLPEQTRILALGVSGEKVWLQISDGAWLHSTDGGRSWSRGRGAVLAPESYPGAPPEIRLPGGTPFTQGSFAPGGRRGFAAAGRELWRTDDGGERWYRVLVLSQDLGPATPGRTRQEVYIPTSSGAVLRSTDGGRTFLSRRLGTGAPVRWVGCEAATGRCEATTDQGAFLSRDGLTWTPASESLRTRLVAMAEAQVKGPRGGRAAPSYASNRPLAVAPPPAPPTTGAGDKASAGTKEPVIGRTPSTVAAPEAVTRDADGLQLQGVAGEDAQPLAAPAEGDRSPDVASWPVPTEPLAAEAWKNVRHVESGPDRREAWATGVLGTVLSTSDGGKTWRLARHETSLPAWYFAVVVVCAGLLYSGLRPRAGRRTVSLGVADLLVSDRPVELPREDVLGLGGLADGIARFIRNERTQPPVTIAVNGEWGSGKTSVLRLLRHKLVSSHSKPVWFNAWHHEQEDNLLAAMYAAIIAQGVPRLLQHDLSLFRLRLMLIRARRRWVTLLGAVTLLAGTAGYFIDHPARREGAIRWLTAIRLPGSPAPEAASPPAADPSDPAAATAATRETNQNGWGLLSGLLGLFALGRVGLTTARSFGVNPAAFLASLEGSVRLADHRERVSFHSRFAEDFRDVTEALGARRMVILIDDLDRCSPANVLKMLDAINFLVSSGGCFVVMALARRLIDEYVGLQLRDAAEALGDPASSPEERRRTHARGYLEKLINIEVNVPSLSPAGARRLVAYAGRESVATQTAWQVASPWVRGVAMAALAVLFVVGAFRFAGAVDPRGAVVPPRAAAPESDRDGIKESEGARDPGRPDSASVEAELTDWEMVKTQEAPDPMWPYLIVFASLMGVLGGTRGRRADPPVKDSQAFDRALQIWHPVILRTCPTPRAVKRFLNRVRFYAMLQRSEAALFEHAFSPEAEAVLAAAKAKGGASTVVITQAAEGPAEPPPPAEGDDEVTALPLARDVNEAPETVGATTLGGWMKAAVERMGAQSTAARSTPAPSPMPPLRPMSDEQLVAYAAMQEAGMGMEAPKEMDPELVTAMDQHLHHFQHTVLSPEGLERFQEFTRGIRIH